VSRLKKQTHIPVNMGISLMLTVFIILCMILFSVLSLSGALKDLQYSQKNALRTSAYYEACNTAEKMIADLYENPLEKDEGSHIEFADPISDSENLLVVLEVMSREEPEYKILTWKQISTKEWNTDQTLPVLGSD